MKELDPRVILGFVLATFLIWLIPHTLSEEAKEQQRIDRMSIVSKNIPSEIESAMFQNYYDAYNDKPISYNVTKAAIKKRRASSDLPFCDVVEYLKMDEASATGHRRTISTQMEKAGINCSNQKIKVERGESLANSETLKRLIEILPSCNIQKTKFIMRNPVKQTEAELYINECLQFQLEQELQK